MNWQNEPQIMWTQDHCKFCSMPLNGCTQCELLADPEKKEGYNWNGAFIPIKAKSCPLRDSNSWKVDINFPVSKSLLKRLNEVNGLKSCRPVGPNQMAVEIAKLVSKEQVEKDFNLVYMNFIKEQQQNLKLTQEIVSVETDALFELPNKTSILIPKTIKDILQSEFE